MEKAQRRPAIEKAISELDDNDFRVRILGTIESRDDENLACVIDDGTGRAVAHFEGSEQLESMEKGKLTRIIGKVRKDGIDVEIAKDMNELDLELMKIINDVIEKLR